MEKIITLLFIVNTSLTQIAIIKYVPANFLDDDKNAVVIKNISHKSVNIKNYFIITRDYAARLPEIVIKPGEKIAFVKKNKGNFLFKTIEYNNIKDFIVRIRSHKEQGNYVVILSSTQEFVDGFYFAPQKYVNFLPEIVKLITAENKIVFLNIPSENYKKWQFITSIEDPIIAFEKINNVWKVVSANPEKDILKLNYFSKFEVKYNKTYNIISANIYSSMPDFKGKVLIKKGKSPEKMIAIDSVFVSANLKTIKFYDINIRSNNLYYYQLVLLDNRGYIIKSNIQEISTVEKKELIKFIPETPYNGEIFYLYVKLNEDIPAKIILFSDKYELINVIYDGIIREDLRTLIPIAESLTPGKYYIVLLLNNKHFIKPLVVN